MARICKECAHFVPEGPLNVTNGGLYAKCAATKMVSLITGEPTMRFCSTERENSHLCGPEGKNWKAK